MIEQIVAQHMNDHPPEGGKPPTDAQVLAVATPVITDWLASHPAAPGQNATPEQIAAAVNDWLTANPPQDGEDGDDASQAQIVDAVAAYFATHPVLNGKDATDAQVNASVAAYMTAHPVVDGKSSELRVSGGFIQWRQTGGDWANLVEVASLKGADGKQVELQKTATAIQWRLTGGTWTDLVLLSALKGDKGDAGNTLVGQVVVGQTAAIAIALGIREITTALAGTVVGERYQAYARSYKLNGATTAVPGRPPGYTYLDCVCNVAGQITVSLNAPLLAIGSSYAITTDIVKVNAT